MTRALVSDKSLGAVAFIHGKKRNFLEKRLVMRLGCDREEMGIKDASAPSHDPGLWLCGRVVVHCLGSVLK